MKVLLFTHKSDIDGMGNAILAQLAFIEVEYVLCETFNIDSDITSYYESGKIYEYDKIFVTDICPSNEILSKISADKGLKDRFLVFDHHKTALEQGCDKYQFVTLKIQDEQGRCSGTSLFYEYLISNNLLPKSNHQIANFVELTRRYDTWEWKTKYNDETAHELTLLFDSVGCEGYIKLMYQKLMDGQSDTFEFSELERLLIDNKKAQVEEKLTSYASKIQYEEMDGMKAGIVFIDYEYRNDLAEYFRQHNYDMDFAMLVSIDRGTISYRSINNNVDVRQIAQKFGGKGHPEAASSPIAEEQKQKLIKILIKKEEE